MQKKSASVRIDEAAGRSVSRSGTAVMLNSESVLRNHKHKRWLPLAVHHPIALPIGVFVKPVFIRPIHVRFFNLRASHSLIGGVCLAAVLGCGSAKVDTTSDAGLDTSDHQDPIGQNTSDNEQPNDGVEPLSPNDDSAPIDDSNPDATVAPGAEDSDASSIDVTAPDPNTGGGFVTIDTGDDGRVEVLCGSSPCACSDGLDNDGDGLVDGFDPECTSPFDNDEGSFATGIPGDNVDPK